MKNSLKYLLGLALMAGFFACKDEEAGPILKVNSPPAITAPASIELSEANETATIDFAWTAADFSLKDLPKTTYRLQLDKAGNNFAKPTLLTITDGLSFQTTVKELNGKLLLMDLLPNVAAGIELRVGANIDNKLDEVWSPVVSLNVTPYTSQVTVKPIYLLGSGTSAGWDNTAALEMTYVKDSAWYEIITTLTPGADKYIKFISKLGAWAPQWGTDATGLPEGGPLVYRPDEATADPPAILAPAVASQYKIIADTANLTYRVYEYGDIWLLGNATAAGWDNTLALPMTKISEGKYFIVTNLTGAALWKIIDQRGAWAPQWGTDANGTADGGPLVYRPDETVPDPAAIPSPATDGLYRIEVDIINLTYTVTPQ
jgi:hypothetical protein